VDKAAVIDVFNETIIYRLDYVVLGPQDAVNAQIVDVLPPNVSLIGESLGTATVDNNYQGSGRTALIWNLPPATLPVGTMGSITVTVAETTAGIGENLINTVATSVMIARRRTTITIRTRS